MDVNRLRTGEKIAGAAAVLLFLDLFLNWYSVDLGGAFRAAAKSAGVDTSVSGWQAFSWTDLLVLLTVLAALAMVFVRGTGRSVNLPASLPLIVAGLGAFATLVVLYRIVNQPGPNDVINVEYGAYLGLILVAALTYGAIQAGGGVDDLRAEAESLTPRETPSAGGTAPPPSGASSVAEAVPPPQAPVPSPPPAPEPPAAVEEPAPEPLAPAPPAPEPPAPDPEPPVPVAPAEPRSFEPDPEPEPHAAEPESRPTFVGDDDEPPASEPSPPRAF
jgi:hypothetical protein